jgi:hypothetical protein
MPSFAGPGLDPSLTFTGDAGITYTNSAGTLSLLKAAGVTKANSIFVSNFVVTGDFHAKLTLGGANDLGSSRFFFAADLASNSAAALGYVSRQSDITANAEGRLYFGKPVQANCGNKGLGSTRLTDDVVIMELVRSGGFSDAFVNGISVGHFFIGATVVPPITFNFGLINQGFSNDLDPAARTAFISNFSVTTPDAPICGGAAPCTSPMPEPASWALLIAGFGLTGAAMRRRRSNWQPGKAPQITI